MNQKSVEFNINLIEQGLTEKARSIMSMLGESMFIIEKYTETEAQYDAFIDSVFHNMLHGFEHKEFREYPIQYKFKDDPDEEVKWMEYRHFIINIMLWRPQICIDPSNLGDHLIITKPQMIKLSRGMIKRYIDINYIATYGRKISNHNMNAIICDCMYWLSRISAKFNPILGLGASIETFRDLAYRIPEFADLMYFKLDESKQPAEMELEIKKKTREQINHILNDSEFNILKPMLQGGAGIKDKQFAEFTLNIGLKPDVEGKTIPKPINANYLHDGLKTIENQYKNSISGRKAAIMNNEFMGKSGYMAILVSIACAQVVLSNTVTDCDTVNPIRLTINDQTELNKLNGRRYKFSGQRTYDIIDSERDVFLIGQTILLRSPITCAAPDGICPECYGDLFYTNRDNQSVGIFSATEIMNPVVQGILSAKHHQATISNIIEFQEGFKNFFDLYSTEISLDPDDYIDLNKHQLVIYIGGQDGEPDGLTNSDGTDEIELKAKPKNKKKKNANVEEEDEIDSDFGTSMLDYHTRAFEVWKMKDPAGLKNNKILEKMKFSDVEGKALFMHEDLLNKMEEAEDENGKKYRYIPLEHINTEEFIFMVDVQNNELTVPLKKITSLLDSASHENCKDYESMAQLMLSLLIQSEMSAMLLHGEVIIRQLIRRKDNVLKRPNFARIITTRDYDILTIKTSLRKNPSITTSLSTNYLKKQLVEQQLTFEKTATSVFDSLFRRDLSHIEETR